MRRIVWIAVIALATPTLAAAKCSPKLQAIRDQMEQVLDECRQLDQDIQGLRDRIRAVAAKLVSVSVEGEEMYVTDANLVIRNGEKSTETTNGLGNLIVGYADGAGARTGSHNLVFGDGPEWTSYGGIVGGVDNSIRAPYATSLSGDNNAATESHAVVLGGATNEATGAYAAICAAGLSTASGEASAICGGGPNEASGAYSVVGGGWFHDAAGEHDWLSGELFQEDY